MNSQTRGSRYRSNLKQWAPFLGQDYRPQCVLVGLFDTNIRYAAQCSDQILLTRVGNGTGQIDIMASNKGWVQDMPAGRSVVLKNVLVRNNSDFLSLIADAVAV